MTEGLREKLQWRNWLRTASSSNGASVLTRRHIYILPTRFGIGFGTILLAMLIGSINYSLSLGFAMTFLLAGAGNIAMLHTWRNLFQLRLRPLSVKTVYAGQDALFEIGIADTRHRKRFSICASFRDAEKVVHDIPESSEVAFELASPSVARGWLIPGRITIHTEFPLNLFHVWSYASMDLKCLVYPHPSDLNLPIPPSPSEGELGYEAKSVGDEDFNGHRTYQMGDPPKKVDWKASSKEQGLLVKVFEGTSKSTLWIDWFKVPFHDSEQRLSQMTRWIIDAHYARTPYGMKLPGLEIPPDDSDSHFHQCMRTLALWGKNDQ